MRRPNFNKGDWAGAFGNIPRTLRLMYVHAYQSYVWNRLVSERLCKLGSSGPVEGDMVFVGEAIDGDVGGGIDDVEVDGSDDDQGGDRSGGIDLSVPRWQQATKVLSAEDVQTAGDGTLRWTIYDVVLPLPGLDIEPATGWMAELYGQILSGDGLTHADVTASKIPEYQLKGSYRHMIVKPKHFRYSISTYSDPDVALTKTDEEICLEASQDSSQTQAPVALNDTTSEAPTTTKPFTALTLHFQLPSSSYATMLMREALKSDTSSFKHRQMTQQSEDQQFKGTSIPL
jgi:tRNA pseudouridine13 synthase